MIPVLVFAITFHSYDPAPWTQPGITTTPPPITAESTADHWYQLPRVSRLISVVQSTRY
jgi:hypothetical protein